MSVSQKSEGELDWLVRTEIVFVFVLIFFAAVPQLAPAIGYQCSNYKCEPEGNTEYRIAVFTVWLALFTGGLTVATVLLWAATKDAVRDAKESATRQAEEFKQQLAIATDAVNASKEQALAVKRVERAYLFGGLSTEFKFRIADTKIQVIATNSGRTAGTISEFYAELLPFQELGPEPEYPTAECRIKTDTVVPAGKEQPLQSGSLDPKKMLLIGYLKYIDMFRDEHTSRFCLLVHGELMDEKSDKLIAYSYGPPAWGVWD